MRYVVVFITVFLIVFSLIPYLKRYALRINFVDRPTDRKKHKEPMPLLGGIGIFIGFMAGFLLFEREVDSQFIAIIVSSLMVLAIGVVDDWYKSQGKEFSVLPRLLVQIAAAVIIYNSGIVFYGFTNPLTKEYIVLPTIVQFLLTVTWILGVTTVINWSDGMDGLAGSLSGISGATLFVVALAKGQPHSAMLSILLVAAVLGFLNYNRHPAQIFMGDSGATFLGFMLAIIALEGAFKQSTVISIFIPILALGVPIFDNIFVVMRRFLEGKPIYQADATQIHHRLLSTGLSPKQVVAKISIVSTCLSVISIIILLLNV